MPEVVSKGIKRKRACDDDDDICSAAKRLRLSDHPHPRCYRGG